MIHIIETLGVAILVIICLVFTVEAVIAAGVARGILKAEAALERKRRGA